MKSQATRVANIPIVGIQAQPEVDADTIPARRHYSALVSATVATIIIAVAGVVMAYAGLGLAMWPG